MYLKDTGFEGIDWISLAQSTEHGTDRSIFLKDRKYLHQQSDCQLLKKDSA
jgi:hypothetical protein